MITGNDEEFIVYWESVREEYGKFMSKLLRGLPMAIVFTLPIFFSLIFVFVFSPEWYTKISQQLNGSLFPIILALLVIIFFVSFMRMHFKWEMNEQLYNELINKKKHE
jgi:branched-subunit amino acid permease